MALGALPEEFDNSGKGRGVRRVHVLSQALVADLPVARYGRMPRDGDKRGIRPK